MSIDSVQTHYDVRESARCGVRPAGAAEIHEARVSTTRRHVFGRSGWFTPQNHQLLFIQPINANKLQRTCCCINYHIYFYFHKAMDLRDSRAPCLNTSLFSCSCHLFALSIPRDPFDLISYFYRIVTLLLDFMCFRSFYSVKLFFSTCSGDLCITTCRYNHSLSTDVNSYP